MISNKLFLLFLLIPYAAYGLEAALPDNPYTSLYKRTLGIEVVDLYSHTDNLYEKYIAAKKREQSSSNKILAATTIGTSGIGGMMLASSAAEQRADADAEQDMQAYLQTIKCRYNDGQTFNNGEKNIQTPGGNDMVALYTEYAALANNLKIRKEALGLRPGIESEIVIDKAATGLYDDVGTGKTGGNYASIARALMDETSQDAKQWQEQKDTSKKKLTTGATLTSVGTAVGITGNITVNKIPKQSDLDTK